MRKTVLGLFCILIGCEVTVLAGNPDYNPNWRTGDTWRVEMTYLGSDARATMEMDSSLRYWENMPYMTNKAIYTYEVIGTTNVGSECAVSIRLEKPDHPITLHIDAHTMVLIACESGEGEWVHWRSNEMAGGPDVQRDFQAYSLLRVLPALPTSSVDQVRVFPDPGGTIVPEATQTLHFSELQVDAVITREVGRGVASTNGNWDADATIGITWEKGKKWWTRATLDVAGRRMATAVLLEE